MLKKVLLSIFVVYTIIGFVILPLVLKSQVVEIVNENTNSKLYIDSLSFNPYIFKLSIEGIELNDLEKKHLFSLSSLEVNLEPSSLLKAALHVKDISIEKPQISLVYNKDKTFNFSSIAKEKPAEKEENESESSELPRVIIDKIAIVDGGLDYEDYTREKKFDFSIRSIGFKLQDIDTNDFTTSGATLRFNSELGDGGEIDFRSRVLGFKPFVVEGSLDFKASKLYTQWKYIQESLGFEVANGSLSFGAKYYLNIDDLDETRVDNLYVSLEKLRVKPKDKSEDMLNLESLHIKNANIKPMQKKLHVKDIDMSNLLVDFIVDSNGDIDWLNYINNEDFVPSSKANSYKLVLGKMKTNLNLDLAMDKNTTNLKVSDVDFELGDFRFNSNATSEKITAFDSFKISGIELETKSKELTISDISLNKLDIDLKKYKNGSLNISGLLASKKSTEVKDVEKQEEVKDEALRIKIAKISLNDSEVSFEDESLLNSAKNRLNDININAYNIDSAKKSWLDYDISIGVNGSGKILSKGQVRHTPLKQKGNLDLQKISLKEITPYLQETLHVELIDGDFSMKSNLSYEESKNKPDLKLDGMLKIEDFELIDSRNKSTLVTFAKTDLKTFQLGLFPSSLFIDRVNLDAFYVDAQIDKNKEMNFAKLSKVKVETKEEIASKEKKVESKDDAFSLKVMQLHVSNGSATFADYSLPLQFKTNIHDLNGDIYAISSSKGEISYIDIDGEIDKYGSTKLKGSIEASDVKSYTDISFNFRNLSLDSYSGYSAQFAGHKIDNGKLFLDLGYKIHNSELLGSNSLVIKGIELGDTIDDENITKLPLGFAIALLEDSKGVIDIDMPVEGNMDEPDFKYGTLVVKTFANLIVKAVASPFNFLGAAMGIDGDKLKYVDFNPAEHIILPSEREKLDNIAQILSKKQKLSLEVIGSYDSELDKKAIALKKLTNEVIKRSKEAIMTIDILEDIYEDSVGDELVDSLKDDFEKKYEDDGKFDVEYHKELLSRCIDIQSVSNSELVDLANKRSFLLKDYLVTTKNIDQNRVIATSAVESAEKDDKRVKIELKIVVK